MSLYHSQGENPSGVQVSTVRRTFRSRSGKGFSKCVLSISTGLAGSHEDQANTIAIHERLPPSQCHHKKRLYGIESDHLRLVSIVVRKE